jgi:ribonucleoside-triphosphate reductase
MAEEQTAKKCTAKTEVYSRVCGFFRPVQQWNPGKKEEFKDRREFVLKEEGLRANVAVLESSRPEETGRN